MLKRSPFGDQTPYALYRTLFCTRELYLLLRLDDCVSRAVCVTYLRNTFLMCTKSVRCGAERSTEKESKLLFFTKNEKNRTWEHKGVGVDNASECGCIR